MTVPLKRAQKVDLSALYIKTAQSVLDASLVIHGEIRSHLEDLFGFLGARINGENLVR